MRIKFKEENSDALTPTNTKSTTSMIMKNDDIEIMELSVEKHSSTEKNIFWKTRNIIAINNYMRKLNPHLIKFSTDTSTFFDKPTSTTTSPTLQNYEIIHPEESFNIKEKNQKFSSESSIKPIVEEKNMSKILYQRSTASISIKASNNKLPEFFNDNRNYQQSDGEYDFNQKINMVTTTDSTTIQNLNTPNSFDVESSINLKRKTLSSSTISTFLSNVSSSKDKLNFMNNKNLFMTPFVNDTINLTTPMTINKNDAKTLSPVQIEESVVQPSPKSFMITTSNILHEGISTTSKPRSSSPSLPKNNGVNAESDSIFYAATGASFILLIIILPLIARQYIFKRKKKNDDIENYSNDIQPISPVITMGTDDGGSVSEESISESFLEFNRHKLHFKSLIGEGNFGKVWKCEIEDHTDQNELKKIVAVKTERVNNGSSGGLKAECEIMRKLLPAHSNVVTYIAACLEQGELCANIFVKKKIFVIILFRTIPFNHVLRNER